VPLPGYRALTEGKCGVRVTSPIDKLLPSVVNVLFTFVLALPVLLVYGVGFEWRIFWIAIFLAYNLLFEFTWGRCLGMALCGTVYERPASALQKVIYVVLYTVSFSTLLFYVWVPFDLLAVNLLLVQLPLVLLTGSTLHGLLSGGRKTVWPISSV
jgi:hypothetical protein